MAGNDIASTHGADRPAAGEPCKQRRRISVTLMGVLESVMWSGGASVMLAFWLWPRAADVPHTGRTGAERGLSAVILSRWPTTDPAHSGLIEWQERFRTATEQAAVMRERPGDPASTGSSSLAEPAAEAAIPGAMDAKVPSSNEPEAVTSTEGFVAAVAMADQSDPPNQKGHPSVVAESAREVEQDPEGVHDARSGVGSAMENGTHLVTVETGLPEPAVVLPPEPEPSLNILGLPETLIGSRTPELLNIEFASGSNVAEGRDETLATAESEPPDAVAELEPPNVTMAGLEPPHVTVPEIDPPQFRVADAEPSRLTVPEVEPPHVTKAGVEPPHITVPEIEPPLVTMTAIEPPHITVPEIEPLLVTMAAIEPHITVPEIDQPLFRVADVEASLPTVPAVEPAHVTVAEAEPLSVDARLTPVSERAQAPHSGPANAIAPADRDLLVLKGEEMLARGDVGGARLFFRRAADSGDARAATGMARTFDPKVLRTLRVYGLRPDPDQAAYWYGRSRALETVAGRGRP
jgi:hypothetical protein